MFSRLNFQILTVFVFAVAASVLIYICLRFADGNLIYALDDPYIHLSVAENILKGRYGVNLEEYSSPSSSILYPFLLAIPVALGASRWGPLLLGLAANGAALWILSGQMWSSVLEGASGLKRLLFFILPPLLILAINAVALPLTGMEHPLHVLGAVCVMAGLIAVAEGRATPWFLVFGILLSALIRFEGLALVAAALIAMAWMGRWRAALALLAAVTALLFSYGFVMHGLGLPVLPSSVLVKSNISAAAMDSSYLSAVMGVVTNLMASFENRWGMMFCLANLAFLLAILRPGARADERVIAATAFLALGAHLLFGRYGWFSRYEVYAVAIMLMALFFVFSRSFRMLPSAPLQLVVLPLGLAIIGSGYVGDTLRTPRASRNVYQQQFQMHRFATDFFPQRVAVNDLGWVTFGNDNYVLDLWGLGSEEARRLTASAGISQASLSALVTEHNVSFAMLYDDWFEGAIPENWCRIAQLNTTQVTVASGTVAFYLIDKSKASEMAAALDAFARSLPAGATLDVTDCTGTVAAKL